MTFLIKRDYDEYIKQQHSCYLPSSDSYTKLVPGDIFHCTCGQHYCWAFYYSTVHWTPISARQARKIIKAHAKGKPFKRHHTPTLGPQ